MEHPFPTGAGLRGGFLPGLGVGPRTNVFLPVFRARCRYLDASTIAKGPTEFSDFLAWVKFLRMRSWLWGGGPAVPRLLLLLASGSLGQPHGADNTGNSSMAFFPAILYKILILAVLNYVMDSCMHSLYTFKLHKVEIHLDYHS